VKALVTADLTGDEKLALVIKLDALLPKFDKNLSYGFVKRLSAAFASATLSEAEKVNLAFNVGRAVTTAEEKHWINLNNTNWANWQKSTGKLAP
jgi:hypothetical protein